MVELDDRDPATGELIAAVPVPGPDALRSLLGPRGGPEQWFGRIVWTGEHQASIEAVTRRVADLCAVDCVTHALLARGRPDVLADTRVLARTGLAPALPYVTRAALPAREVARLGRALRRASEDPTLAATREALLLRGFADPPPHAYQGMRALA